MKDLEGQDLCDVPMKKKKCMVEAAGVEPFDAI
jgi:hypothetical protein